MYKIEPEYCRENKMLYEYSTNSVTYKYFSWWYVVAKLRCNPEGRRLNSRRSMALRSTQPLMEMSDRIISWAVKMAGA